MPFRERTGDLFAQGLPALAHGCNCRGSMAGGIARDFSARFPAMFAEYARRCASGEFSLGDVFVWDAEELVVYNLATQVRSGRDARLDAVASTVATALADAEARGLDALGLPMIGAGIGGLDRSAVHEALRAAGEASGVELVLVRRLSSTG